MKHTPEPWEIHTGDDEIFEIHPAGDEEGFHVICEIPKDGYGDKKANARLIVAAPDLLETLKQIAKGYNKGGKLTREYFQKIAQQAIAKAEKGGEQRWKKD